MSLTPKQECFVQEFLVDMNATQAAIRAGYSEKTAQEIGSENLSKPMVAEAIAAAQKERAERTAITSDMIVAELARIGFSDLRKVLTPGGNLIDPQDWDDDTAAAISSVEVVVNPSGGLNEDGSKKVEHTHKLKVWDKVSALEKLGKYLGMFKETHAHEGKIQIEDVSQDAAAFRSAIVSIATRSGATESPGEPD